MTEFSTLGIKFKSPIDLILECQYGDGSSIIKLPNIKVPGEGVSIPGINKDHIIKFRLAVGKVSRAENKYYIFMRIDSIYKLSYSNSDLTSDDIFEPPV